MWLTLLFSGTAGLFFLWTLFALWHLRWVRRLPQMEELGSGGATGAGPAKPIRCSVVIAARDEAARLGETLYRLLRQRQVELEVIVVDDRSTDATGEILRRYGKEDARLQVKRVGVLPEGWLGKCHACHIGAGAATGDWILFTDADCWLKPDVIARALCLGEREGVEHVTLAPGIVTDRPSAKAWHLLFQISLVNWCSGVNRDRRGSFLGIGAFNLVRTSAYRRCGGYEALRMTVVDDMKLGLLLRRSGGKTRVFLGADDVECHWATTIGGLVKIMEKNYFAALDYRLLLVLAGSLFTVAVFAILLLGLISGTMAGFVAALSPFSLALPAGILARRLNWSAECGVFVPFMLPVFLYALLNSTFVALRQGGIRWRDTLYPLKALRQGNVR